MTRQRIIASIMIAFASVILLAGAGTCAYYRGKAMGRADVVLEQELAKRKVIAAQQKVNDSRTTKDSLTAAKLKGEDERASRGEARARKDYATARAKVKISGDTTTFEGLPPIVLPELATLIHLADSHGDSTVRSLKVKDDLIVALEVLVADERRGKLLAEERAASAEKSVAILEKERRPRFGVKTGIVAGVAGTLVVIKAIAELVKVTR